MYSFYTFSHPCLLEPRYAYAQQYAVSYQVVAALGIAQGGFMPQPCIQQTAFKVHQLADNEMAQLCLSLRFRCPETKRRAYLQREQQPYHVILLAVFVLTFFLILEWAGPLPALPPRTTIQQQPSVPLRTTDARWATFAERGSGVSNGMVFVDNPPQ